MVGARRNLSRSCPAQLGDQLVHWTERDSLAFGAASRADGEHLTNADCAREFLCVAGLDIHHLVEPAGLHLG